MSKPLIEGASITIKRSDGRTHQAVVSSIDFDIGCVKWSDHMILVPSSSTNNLLLNKEQRVSSVKHTRSTFDNFPSDLTLKKLGKLEKNRSERRRKQAELRAEKAEISKKSMGNPHWELVQMINDYRRKVNFAPLSRCDRSTDHQITVAVRKRPLNSIDYSKREVDIVTIPSSNQLIIHEPKNKVDLTKYIENHVYKFDYTFNETCINECVYKYTAQPLVNTIFEGGMATCFAYGQTGSGKTFTMSGNYSELDTEKGIYALTASDIFSLIHSSKYRDLNLAVSCSFFEIYSKKVFDLLNNKATLKILEDAKQQVQIIGLTEKAVTSVDDVLKLILQGNIERASGQTSANTNSACKLTQVLRDSFVKPNSKTCMIAMISPGMWNGRRKIIKSNGDTLNNQKEDVQKVADKTDLLKIDRTVLNSHRETIGNLKSILKDAEEMSIEEFSYKKWDSLLDSGIALSVEWLERL
ncbi:unnamed protein product [Brassicogethes aeneus]|uniref:Kinesin motor domain-containing protein n=1 Tax=Brassicogethes aeneus TaxID=1431903 RepID=A0A9P0FJV6_BRAAE|nr:unnamed protein product [Brassicogethes aeneus]